MMNAGTFAAMRITVDTKPFARNTSVTEIAPSHFKIAVREAPRDGEANEAVIAALAEHLGVAKSRFAIRSGRSGRRKIIEFR